MTLPDGLTATTTGRVGRPGHAEVVVKVDVARSSAPDPSMPTIDADPSGVAS